jgi:hypothetical protein
LLVLAAGLRLAEFLVVRPLWIDELMLALNIGRRSFAGLLAPLSYDQSSPILFIWLVKAVTLVGGMSEPVLRAVPLVVGLVFPWAVWRMTRRFAGIDVGLIAATLAAVSILLIRYSAELKPYGLDALVTVTLVALTLRARLAPERPDRWWQLLAGGLLAMTLSIPAVFVLCGAIAALAIDARVRATALGLRRTLLLGAAWTTGFVLLYWLIYHPQVDSEYMRRYWSETFLNLRAPNVPSRIYTAGNTLLGSLPPVPEVVGMRWRVAALALGVLGLLRRGGLAAAFQVGVPFLGLFCAEALGRYPASERLVLFLSPLEFIAVGALLAEGLRLLRLSELARAGTGMLFVLAWSGTGVVRNTLHPVLPEEGREAARLVTRSPLDEPVYVMAAGLPAWAYYSTDWERPDTARLDHFARLMRAAGPAAHNSLIEPQLTPSDTLSLRYPGQGRLELVGRRSGVFYRPEGRIRRLPDSTWARREVDRIVSLATPRLWIFGSHYTDEELQRLREELNRRAIVPVVVMEEKRAIALRIRVPEQAPGDRSAPQ